MWQDCSLTAVHRNAAFVEQSWWAWTEYAWINAMVFVPMAKAPPRAGAKLLYSANLIHEFTSSFSPNVIYASLFGKTFPRKQAFVDISIDVWLHKQQPRFAQDQPKGYFQLKELHTTTIKLILKWMLIEMWTMPSAKMWQDCSLSAVQRKTALVEQSCWPELKMFWSMPLSSFLWQKLLAGAKELLHSLNLIHDFVSRRWWIQVCLGRPSHGIRPL